MNIPPSPPPGPILGLYSTPDAGAYYRIVVPLSVVPGATWASDDDNSPNRLTQAQLDAAETVILYRPGGPVADIAALFADLRSRPNVKYILVDLDDAAFAHIPVIEVRPSAVALEGLSYALAHCDGVIVQNDALVAHYAPDTRKPFTVVPNFVRLDDWPEPPPVSEPPVVVLAGSPSHGLDWEQVIPTLRWLREDRPDVGLRVIGCPHPVARDLATEYIEWVDPDQYPALLHGGSIGLCPLPLSPFNVCKSQVKAFEYVLAAGMAVIGSPTQYANVLAEGRGFIVQDGNYQGWTDCIGFYLEHPEIRTQHATALRAWIAKYRDVRRWAAHLTSLYGGSR